MIKVESYGSNPISSGVVTDNLMVRSRIEKLLNAPSLGVKLFPRTLDQKDLLEIQKGQKELELNLLIIDAALLSALDFNAVTKLVEQLQETIGVVVIYYFNEPAPIGTQTSAVFRHFEDSSAFSDQRTGLAKLLLLRFSTIGVTDKVPPRSPIDTSPS